MLNLVYSSTFQCHILCRPPEAHHLNCFEQWAVHTTVCSALRAKSEQDPKGELIYAKEFGIKWSQLRNQVVWRGTDFGYLGVSVCCFTGYNLIDTTTLL